jgi:hypothetical protein
MIYIKARWDEPRADRYAVWGCSWWFFEIDQAGAINRQVEVYDSGVRLRYDRNHLSDEFGMLGEGRLQDMDIPGAEELTAEQFEAVWESVKSNGAGY